MDYWYIKHIFAIYNVEAGYDDVICSEC
jgi:hypothetical protein